MHSRLLKNEEQHWWIGDVGGPLISVVFISLLGRFFLNSNLPYFKMLTSLAFLFLLSVFASIISCAQIRNKALLGNKIISGNLLVLHLQQS